MNCIQSCVAFTHFGHTCIVDIVQHDCKAYNVLVVSADSRVVNYVAASTDMGLLQARHVVLAMLMLTTLSVHAQTKRHHRRRPMGCVW